VAKANEQLELTVLIPCLNEAETVGLCVRKARESLERLGVSGEVLVADNGSEDDSARLAAAAGARVIHVPERGYGSALLAGIEAARGRFILMADADDSYDLENIEPFLAKLREGFDLVQGCRLPAGGGRVERGAMPFLHRWVGNPLFTRLARWWFGTPVHDTNCGMRAFRRDFIQRLELRCTGMEFANEMLIKAALHKGRVAEVPVVLRPDARRTRASHLRTFRDGWRTLRFYLLYSPRWLFLAPGLALTALGAAGMGAALLRPGWPDPLGGYGLLLSMLAVLMGYQSVLFALLTKAFAVNEGLLPMDRKTERFFQIMTLERGLALGALGLGAGAAVLAGQWLSLADRPGPLSVGEFLRLGAPGAALCALGFQTILFSFFASLLGMRRR